MGEGAERCEHRCSTLNAYFHFKDAAQWARPLTFLGGNRQQLRHTIISYVCRTDDPNGVEELVTTTQGSLNFIAGLFNSGLRLVLIKPALSGRRPRCGRPCRISSCGGVMQLPISYWKKVSGIAASGVIRAAFVAGYSEVEVRHISYVHSC